jgi:hypothetical protein
VEHIGTLEEEVLVVLVSTLKKVEELATAEAVVVAVFTMVMLDLVVEVQRVAGELQILAVAEVVVACLYLVIMKLLTQGTLVAQV